LLGRVAGHKKPHMLSLGRGRKKKTVGVDLGSGYVKVAVIDHGKEFPQIEQLAMRPIDGAAIVDGDIVEPGLVVELLTALFDEEQISARDVVAGVGGRDVIIKLIRMDRMDESEAREVIPWEAEQHVPFEMDNVQLDFEITDPDGEGLQMTVLLVAAKKEVVENRVALMEEAGLAPRIVDVDALALHNALEVNYPAAMEGLTALINVGHDTTTVNVLDDGIPLLTRDMSFGTRRLAAELEAEQGMAPDEARAVLRGEGSSALFSDFLGQRAHEVARGVERAAAFLDTHEIGIGIGRLYLSGGGVRVPGLAESLAERLGVETQITSAFEQIQIKPEAVNGVDLDAVAPMMMLPVGLALRRLR